jgi:DnaJ-class molecular chaperone
VLATIEVRPHERFTLQGKDIHLELPISLPEAIMGAKVTVPTIAGPVRISVPPGSNSGRSLRLKGRSVAVPGAAPGDQLVRLVVTLPEQPDPELDAFVRRWSEKHPYDPRDVLEVDIPPGCKDGSVLRLKGQGNPGNLGGPPGDLLATILVRPHERFTLHGKDIHLELPISLPEAVLGAQVTVPTIAGSVRIRVPAGSNSGRSLRLKGRGIAAPGAASGDQLVRLVVTLPEQPDPELDAFVRRWAETHRYDPRGEVDP